MRGDGVVVAVVTIAVFIAIFAFVRLMAAMCVAAFCFVSM